MVAKNFIVFSYGVKRRVAYWVFCLDEKSGSHSNEHYRGSHLARAFERLSWITGALPGMGFIFTRLKNKSIAY